MTPIRHFKLISCLLFICHINVLKAELNSEHKIHHFFNATLLQPDEKQISVVTNYRQGIYPTLEVGTLGIGWLSKVPNISMKHEMFTIGKTKTAFSGHIMVPVALSQKYYGHGEMFGVTTTTSFNNNIDLNLGLFDLSASIQSYSGSDTFSGGIIFPVAGLDWIVNRRLGLTALWLVPTYGFLHAEQNSGQIDGSFFFFNPGQGHFEYLGGFFLTSTFSFDSFNFEIGFFGQSSASLYLNLFWRYL